MFPNQVHCFIIDLDRIIMAKTRGDKHQKGDSEETKVNNDEPFDNNNDNNNNSNMDINNNISLAGSAASVAKSDGNNNGERALVEDSPGKGMLIGLDCFVCVMTYENNLH